MIAKFITKGFHTFLVSTYSKILNHTPARGPLCKSLLFHIRISTLDISFLNTSSFMYLFLTSSKHPSRLQSTTSPAYFVVTNILITERHSLNVTS